MVDSCDGNCAACPSMAKNHLDEHKLPNKAPGPYTGLGLVGRCGLVFVMPLILAVLTSLGASSQEARFGLALLGLAMGIAVAFALSRLMPGASSTVTTPINCEEHQ